MKKETILIAVCIVILLLVGYWSCTESDVPAAAQHCVDQGLGYGCWQDENNAWQCACEEVFE